MANFDNTIETYTTTGLDNSFSWQVGYQQYVPNNQNPQFRATIRPLTNEESYNRIPNSAVLYEETGILINNVDNLGTYTFSLATNAAINGGPFRDYQLVIEAHDSQGNTSAGNKVGTSNEDGWTAYPFGYDVVAVSNPRQTGIELSNHIETSNYWTGYSGYYLMEMKGITSTVFTGRSSLYSSINGTGLLKGTGFFYVTTGTGLFDNGNFFSGYGVTTSFLFTGTGIAFNSSFTGSSLFLTSGRYYSGIKNLGDDVIISGTANYTGRYFVYDISEITPKRDEGFSSRGYFDGNGAITIYFTDGNFNEDIVGGYIYVSTGRFAKLNAAINTGPYGGEVQKSRFTFDSVYRYIYHPAAASNFRGAPYLYASVSFFDALDKIIIDGGTDIATGLYVSNNAIIFSDSAIGSVSIGGIGTVMTLRYNGDISGTSLTDALITNLIGSNNKAIAITSDGTTSVIYYVTTPIITSPYGGGTEGGTDGGIGGGAVTPPAGGLGNIVFDPDFVTVGSIMSVPINLSVSAGGTATRIHYKVTTSLTAPAEGTYTTYVGTSINVSVLAGKHVWGRVSDGTTHSTWDYATVEYDSGL